MKRFILFVVLAVPLCGQWVVYDPANHATSLAIQSGQVAQHVEVIARWAENLEKLNQQIRQAEEALRVQARIRDVLGDPVAAGPRVTLDALGAADAGRVYGDTIRAARRLANAVQSLQSTLEGTFEALDDRTVLQSAFTRRPELYRRYAAIEKSAATLEQVHDDTDARLQVLHVDAAGTLVQIQSAATQAEVDKLNAKLTALNGQIAHVDAQRRDAADRLRAQQILNENQAAKEKQDLLEKQIAEERQTLGAVGAWQSGIKLTPTNYSRP